MLSGVRILIVEDEALVAVTLSDAVEDAGGEVVGIASTVGEARRLIKMLAFHVAVLDLQPGRRRGHACPGGAPRLQGTHRDLQRR